jgi:uncharacterized protein (TIGR02145 family)
MKKSISIARAKNFLPQHILLILLIGVIGVQTIISCSGDDGDEGGNPSSSSGVAKSSSSGGGAMDECSIELPPVASPCIDGEVVIGTQIWSKCNLNVEPSMGKSACYCNKPENCEKYGRLYDWATAMALDTACNHTLCDSLINYQHQGICPAGWHIPSDDDWGRMIEYAFKDKGNLSPNPYVNNAVGGHLKATSGWNWNKLDNKDGNGTDVYGFSALPGGHGTNFLSRPVSFTSAGEFGEWWSTTETKDGYANSWSLFYRSDLFTTMGDNDIVPSKGSRMYSVRCVKDVVADCAGFVEGTEREHYGRSKPQFCDSRDGKKYVYVNIGEQTWMAENLDYKSRMEYSKCYKNEFANCDKYGRFYDRETAKKVCPSGWHLPSDAEWTTLTNFVGSSAAGTKLKAASGWNDYEGKSGNGTDDYGFSALPGGRNYRSTEFYDIGSKGFWWSSTGEDDSEYLYFRDMSYNNAGVTRESSGYVIYSEYVCSVRCVKD